VDTGIDFAFLALAFVVWGTARWFCSLWAWYIGVGGSLVSVVVLVLRAGWPEPLLEQARRQGYWVLLCAALATLGAFVLLPRPERPSPGESLPRSDVERGRTGLSITFGAWASFVMVASHALLVIPGRFIDASSPAGALFDPSTSENYLHRLATLILHAYPEVDASRSLVVGAWNWPWDAALETAWLTLPVAFVAAARTRRSLWSRLGAGLAALVSVVTVAWLASPWQRSRASLDPVDVLWSGPAIAFLIAFLLLPPRPRAAAAR
jgi:hypothetical protein